MIRMAEVYLHSKKTGKLLMMPEQDVVVGRECLQFRVSLLNPQECPMYGINGDAKNQLKECDSYLAINNGEHDTRPVFARDNEVGLGIADPHPSVDRYGSSFDEGSICQFLRPCPESSPSGFSPAPVIFDSSPVRADNISVDAFLADMRNVLLMRFDSSGDVLRRLIAVEFPLHECSENGMLHDLHCLILAAASGNICLVPGFLGIIGVLDCVMCYLVPDS